ncbi:MAG: arylsulfatase [Flavobacteriaceae bacterium]|nr:arylsulfatase [Flavobacteriaceae bacterium]
MSKTIQILKRLFLLPILCSLLYCSDAIEKTKPNIIIVMTDDQGYGDLGINGNSIIKTPNLDAFASNSIRFSNYHVGTTCSPTRAGLMTGRNCVRNGVWHTNAGCSLLHQEEKTMADVFSKEGYKTGMFGKWHLGDNYSFLPEQRGFETTFYHKGGGVGQTPDYWLNDYENDTYFRNGIPEQAQGFCTDVFFDEAITFIENNKEEPFLCYLSLNAPHSPFNVPEDYYKRYEKESELLESQKRFYGMISNIDDNFERLRQKLEQLQIMDNTILIFTTDNGTSNGYQFDQKENKWYGYNAGMRGTKTSEYDGGHRVPFLLYWKNKGFTGGQIYEGLSAHVDLLPTLATFANIEFKNEKKLDGTDLSHYITTNQEAERMLVTDTQRNQWPEKYKQSCVMYGDWRLINKDELYNVKTDPGQINNVFSENTELGIKMQQFYDSWWEDASKEFRYTHIDIEPDRENILTAHDIHVDKTAWHQKDIRSGNTFETGNFNVNFRQSGSYEIILRRWPKESQLPLNAEILDGQPEKKYWNELIDGKKMNFTSAYLILDQEKYHVQVDPSAQDARFKLSVDAGETTLETGFLLSDKTKTTAFYTEVKRLD